jgi:AhpD family alkylhydroperoxidase
MKTRVNVQAVEPAAYSAMFGLEKYLQGTSLKKSHKELLGVQAPEINGCAFCLDMHTKDAIKGGETAQRLFLLSAWRETDLFDEEEKAILALTEQMTLIHQGGVSNEVYEQAANLFDEHYLSQLIMAIVTINAWNRIAITTHLPISK